MVHKIPKKTRYKKFLLVLVDMNIIYHNIIFSKIIIWDLGSMFTNMKQTPHFNIYSKIDHPNWKIENLTAFKCAIYFFKNKGLLSYFIISHFKKNLCNYCEIMNPSNTPSKKNSLSKGSEVLNLIFFKSMQNYSNPHQKLHFPFSHKQKTLKVKSNLRF